MGNNGFARCLVFFTDIAFCLVVLGLLIESTLLHGAFEEENLSRHGSANLS
jgi:hypothetical protein